LEKDFSKNALLLCSLIIIFLISISTFSEFQTPFFSYKKSDILRDIRIKKVVSPAPKKAENKLLTTHKPAKLKKTLPIPKGLVEFEDFSADGQYLQPVFSKLKSLANGNQPLRIAFFGDSFTEGEIITADVREMLQEKFGGEGGGFIPLRIESAGPSPLAEVKQTKVSSYSIVANRGKYEFQGISGRYFLARNNASLSMRCNNLRPKTNNSTFARLLFRPLDEVDIRYSANNQFIDSVHFDSSKSLKMIEIDGKVNNVSFNFQNTDSVILYGVAFDCLKGVILDNLSLRSNSGLTLTALSSRQLAEFNRLRPYDLVILQYGLNAFPSTGNFSGYKKGMIHVINHLKASMPNARFILFSMSDKGENIDGEVVTHHLLADFIQTQKEMAEETGICFWNMFEAMGGEGTIARWAQAEKPLAAKDYTHIGPGAGRIIAKKFVSSFLFEQTKFQ